jgi:hypothetical protein
MRGIRDLCAETAVAAVDLVGDRGGGEEALGQLGWGRRRGDRASLDATTPAAEDRSGVFTRW